MREESDDINIFEPITIIKEEIISDEDNVYSPPEESPNPVKPDNTSIRVKSALHVKKKRNLEGMKSFELWHYLKTDIVKFCQDQCLIAKRVTCYCGDEMKIENKNKYIDGIVWRCNSAKHPNFATMSIRKGTWFEGSRILIKDILWIAYMWIYSYSNASMLHESDKTYMTVKDWCNSCSEACQAILETKTDPIGGSLKLVELFECQIEDKKKTVKRMKKSAENSDWVLCGLEQFNTKLVLVFVKDKKSQTLLEIIKKYILPGTTLFGNNWTSFRELSKQDFVSLTEEHEITFFDSVSQRELNIHDDFLHVAERPQRSTNGWCNFKYDTQFCEYMYRKSLGFSKDAYLTFLRDIAKINVPHDKSHHDGSCILPS